MPLQPPGFVQSGSDDSLAEYKAFVAASRNGASHLLAELTRLQTFRNPGEAQDADDKATSMGGLYCRKCDGWAVFYAIRRMPFQVTIVLAGDMAVESFAGLESRAAKRRPSVVDGY